MKKCLSILIAVLLITSCLITGCDNKEKSDIVPDRPIQTTTDKMRTYYQIFPYSFADSNGDGVGDIQGIIDKLDYIESLNYDGLYLTPVHQSPTYHKYDVIDYKTIDKEFGTMEDYDNLVKECHDRGMTIILDLVFNHTAIDNEWFERCYIAKTRNDTQNKYYNFYNIREVDSLPNGWQYYSGKWGYECRFWGGMPDLNLQNVLDEPNGYLAKELEEVMRFWLIDHDVDGFRLDAVTSYFTADVAKNTEFLTWLNKTAKAIKPDCYIVGEGAWGGEAENHTYQQSGIDSFFAFQHGYSANGNLSYSVRLEKAAYLYMIDQNNYENCLVSTPGLPNGIPATFIANHDTGRGYDIATARAKPSAIKLMHGLMAMCYGATFNYYGDEAGMSVCGKMDAQGNTKDEDKRQPMPWGDSYTCKPVRGTTVQTAERYQLGTVNAQLQDPNSLINYVKKANAIRRSYPQIARNVAEQVYINGDRTFCIVSKGEGADKIYIAFNVSSKAGATFDTKDLGNLQIGATLSISEIPRMDGTKLIVPTESFAILHTKG